MMSKLTQFFIQEAAESGEVSNFHFLPQKFAYF